MNAFDYIKDVHQRLSIVSPYDYFKRSNPKIKYLVDEELPLATFVKILLHPNREINVQYHGKDHPFDATINVSGTQAELELWPDKNPIEITTAYYDNAAYVREELAETGTSFGPGDISRSEGKVISKAISRDMDDEGLRIIEVIKNSLARKYEKEYPAGTIVVCAIYDEIPLTLKKWLNIIKNTYNMKRKYDTYFIETFTSHYQMLRKSN